MNLNSYAQQVHTASQKWWHDLDTGERLERNKGEMLALMHSELSEMLEGIRKNLQDDKLPHRKMEEVELVDLLIRAFDYAGAYGFDLDSIFHEKMKFNASRYDHKPEFRRLQNGKKF